MSATTIEWTATVLPDGTSLPGYTFNPWIGCTKVSPGCDNCYAENQNGFYKWNPAGWGPHADRKRTSASYWRQPLKWNREAEASGIRRKVFCASLADVFDNHKSIDEQWRLDLWRMIRVTPALDWLLLTKRPQNIAKMLPDSYGESPWGDGWPNVWLGTTAENQEEADRRIPILLATPAAVWFVSAEPLLGPIDFNALADGYENLNGLSGLRENPFGDIVERRYGSKLDWVIVGGESGRAPRDNDFLANARAIRDQCQSAGVAFFGKQNVGKAPLPADLALREWPR